MNICWKLQNFLLSSLEGRQCRKLPTSGQNCSHIVTTRAIPSLLLKKNLLRHFVQQSNQFHLYFWAKLLTYSCNNFISVLQHSFLRLLKKKLRTAQHKFEDWTDDRNRTALVCPQCGCQEVQEAQGNLKWDQYMGLTPRQSTTPWTVVPLDTIVGVLFGGCSLEGDEVL